MTLYSIHAKPEKGPEALSILPERFVWTAFLFAPLWALAHGAFAYLLVWVALTALLVWGAPVIGADAALALYGVFALWTGFAAHAIATRALGARNWIVSGELVAPDAATAERLWLEQIYGGRP